MKKNQKQRNKKKNYYAVAYGPGRGIYRSHTTAFKPSSVLKHPMGKYKGFRTLAEAEAHMSKFGCEPGTYEIEDAFPDPIGEMESWWVVAGDDDSEHSGIFLESMYDGKHMKSLVYKRAVSLERAPSENVAREVYVRVTK